MTIPLGFRIWGAATPQERVMAARSWIGTPFVPHAHLKGAGVDCVQLALCYYQEFSLFPLVDLGSYTMDGGRHLERSRVLEWIEESNAFMPVDISKELTRAGDLACFRVGRIPHHCGILTEMGGFVHALRGSGVKESSLADPTWNHRLEAVFRIKEAV